MTENLLQYIWQYRLYLTAKPLKTLDGEPLIVLHPGQLNTNAGPDFLEAKIKVGDTTWAGNIEIHIFSSDWNRHKHKENENYDKLILHVVYINDAEIETYHRSNFPTLELKSYLQHELIDKYRSMMLSDHFIPCARHIAGVKPLTFEMQMQRMIAERLEEKTLHIHDLLIKCRNNWHEVFYLHLARCFGLHINQDAFQQLALCTPFSLLAKHKNDPIKIEAILFGQAGFLSGYFDEEYPVILQQEYMYLKKLYHLHPISKSAWKFLRLRPANFPTIRIAQFARLMMQSEHLFSRVIACEEIKDIGQLFIADVSGYWLSHYTFHESVEPGKRKIGKTFMQSIIINAIVPVLFKYGKYMGNQQICDKAIRFLQEIPAEQNAIASHWRSLNVPVEGAASTQALLQLYKKYCTHKKCLECGIGYEILKQG